jgi:hypothetical protein
MKRFQVVTAETHQELLDKLNDLAETDYFNVIHMSIHNYAISATLDFSVKLVMAVEPDDDPDVLDMNAGSSNDNPLFA